MVAVSLVAFQLFNTAKSMYIKQLIRTLIRRVETLVQGLRLVQALFFFLPLLLCLSYCQAVMRIIAELITVTVLLWR